MPDERVTTGISSAARLLASLYRSKSVTAFSRYARRRGAKLGEAARPEWDQGIRLLLLARGRLPDQEWKDEVERLLRKWRGSNKARATDLTKFLEKGEVYPWLRPDAMRVWIQGNENEALKERPRLDDPLFPNSPPGQAEAGTEVAVVQAAFLSGILDAIQVRKAPAIESAQPMEES